MDTRTVVTKVMPAVVKILKARFPNLTAEETVKLAGDICDAVTACEKEEPIASKG